MYHNKDNSSGDPSEEEICVLPCQKIFMMSEGVKNILNDILSETNFILENFDELDIESFQLKDKEKKVKY